MREIALYIVEELRREPSSLRRFHLTSALCVLRAQEMLLWLAESGRGEA